MKQLLVAAMLLLVSALFSSAQTAQQLTDRTVITLAGDGKKISFSIRDAKTLYAQLLSVIDVTKPETRWMPPAMRERLTWLKNNAHARVDTRFPSGWKPGEVAPSIADASYCNIGMQRRPCITVYVSDLMIYMRVVYDLQKPDEKFRMDFALTMAHEAVHHEKPFTFFVGRVPVEKRVQEEIRAWHKVVRDMVVPLRRMKKPLADYYIQADNLLRPCKYTLPCKPFESWIRQHNKT